MIDPFSDPFCRAMGLAAIVQVVWWVVWINVYDWKKRIKR